MTLIPNWRAVMRHAWSVRLIVVAGILTGAEAILPLVPELLPVRSGYFAVLTFLVVMGALIARFVVQRKVTGDE